MPSRSDESVAFASRQTLEQLRALENGIGIAVVRVNYESIGVDVPADVARVEALLAGT